MVLREKLKIYLFSRQARKARRDKEDRTQEFSKTIKSLKRRQDDGDESMAVVVLFICCASREFMIKQKEVRVGFLRLQVCCIVFRLKRKTSSFKGINDCRSTVVCRFDFALAPININVCLFAREDRQKNDYKLSSCVSCDFSTVAHRILS